MSTVDSEACASTREHGMSGLTLDCVSRKTLKGHTKKLIHFGGKALGDACGKSGVGEDVWFVCAFVCVEARKRAKQ